MLFLSGFLRYDSLKQSYSSMSGMYASIAQCDADLEVYVPK